MKNLDARVKMILAAVGFAILHAIIYLAFGLKNFIGEGENVSVFGMIVCGILMVLEIALLIVCRKKKCTWLLKGLFLFRFIGIIFFVIAFALSIAKGSTDSGIFTTIFGWYSVQTFPLAALFSVFLPISKFYGKAVVFAIMTYASGAVVTSIRKEQAFNKKMAERDEMQEESERRRQE